MEFVLIFEIVVVINGLLSGHRVHAVNFEFVNGLAFDNEFVILRFGFELIDDGLEGKCFSHRKGEAIKKNIIKNDET